VGLPLTGPREATLGAGRTLSEFAAAQSVPLTRFAYLLCGDPDHASGGSGAA